MWVCVPPAAILDKIKELKADHPEMTVDEVLEGLGLQEGSSVPPRPGIAGACVWGVLVHLVRTGVSWSLAPQW